ncbi:MAG: hypothetical protein M1812_000689 [Candelaria pacifica]|nr:MAG: hypothetical protein M1812_000689 [Candelaria pacifica]
MSGPSESGPMSNVSIAGSISATKNRRTPHRSSDSPPVPRPLSQDVGLDGKAKLRASDNKDSSDPDTEDSSDDAESFGWENKKQQQAPPRNEKGSKRDPSSDSAATSIIKTIWSSLPSIRSRANNTSKEPLRGLGDYEEPTPEVGEDVSEDDEDLSSISEEDRKSSQSTDDSGSEDRRVPSEDEDRSEEGEEVPLISDEAYRLSRSTEDPSSDVAGLAPLNEVEQDSLQESTNIQADEGLSPQIPTHNEPASKPSEESDRSQTTQKTTGKVRLVTSLIKSFRGEQPHPSDPETSSESEASQESSPLDPQLINNWLEKVPHNSSATGEHIPEDTSQGIGESDRVVSEDTQPLPLTDEPVPEQFKESIEEIDTLYDSFGPYSRKYSEQPQQELTLENPDLPPSVEKSPTASSTSSEEFPIRGRRTLTPPSQPRLAIRNPSANDSSGSSQISPNIVSDDSSSDDTSDDEPNSDATRIRSLDYPGHQPDNFDNETIPTEGQFSIDPRIAENLERLRENGISKQKRQDVVESYWPDFEVNQYISPEEFDSYKAKWDEATNKSNAITFDIMAKLEMEKRHRTRERVRRKHAEKKFRNLQTRLPPEQPNIVQRNIEQPTTEKTEQPTKEQPTTVQPKTEQLKIEQPKIEQLKIEQSKADEPKTKQSILNMLDTRRGPPNSPKFYEDENDRPQSEKGKFLYNNFDDKIIELTVKVLLLRVQFAIDNADYNAAESMATEAKDQARKLSYKPLEARAWFWKGHAELGRTNWGNAKKSFAKAKPCIGVYAEGMEVLEGIEVAKKAFKRAQRRLTDILLAVRETPNNSGTGTPMAPGSAINTSNNLMLQLSNFGQYQDSPTLSRPNSTSVPYMNSPSNMSIRPGISSPSYVAMHPRFSSPFFMDRTPSVNMAAPVRKKTWLSAAKEADALENNSRPISAPLPKAKPPKAKPQKQ